MINLKELITKNFKLKLILTLITSAIILISFMSSCNDKDDTNISYEKLEKPTDEKKSNRRGYYMCMTCYEIVESNGYPILGEWLWIATGIWEPTQAIVENQNTYYQMVNPNDNSETIQWQWDNENQFAFISAPESWFNPDTRHPLRLQIVHNNEVIYEYNENELFHDTSFNFGKNFPG